jgi:hypothetical protein
MKTIYKYKIEGTEIISLPPNAKVIHAAMQNGAPHIWVEYPVNDSELESRTFMVCGTGFELEDDDIHLGSMIDGMFVWHIYEMKP